MKNKALKPFKLYSLAVKTVSILLTCLFFLSCEKQPAEEQPVLEFDAETFSREWAAWEALGIKDYSVKVKMEVHEPFPESNYYRLTVRENIAIEVESLDGYDYSLPHLMPTISVHFVRVESLSRACKNSRGYIRLTYNMDYHYPEIIDYSLPEGGRNGQGSVTIYLSEFAKITPDTEK